MAGRFVPTDPIVGQKSTSTPPPPSSTRSVTPLSMVMGSQEDDVFVSKSASPIAVTHSATRSTSQVAAPEPNKPFSLLDIGDKLSRLAAEQQMRSMKAYLLSYQLTRLQALVKDIEVTVADLKQEGWDGDMVQAVQLDVETTSNNAKNLGEFVLNSSASQPPVRI